MSVCSVHLLLEPIQLNCAGSVAVVLRVELATVILVQNPWEEFDLVSTAVSVVVLPGGLLGVDHELGELVGVAAQTRRPNGCSPDQQEFPVWLERRHSLADLPYVN